MKTILLLTLLLSGNLCAQRATVSIIQLIANPEKYDGKVVRFEGVTNIEFEGNGIYLSKEHWSLRKQSFAIWLDLDEELSKNRKSLNGKYCIVEGTFHADDRGHMGLYMGSLSGVTMFYAREPISPGTKKPEKEAEQGTGQPATSPESKSEGGDKPQPEAEELSR